MSRYSKRHVTLIEILIATALTTILLMALTYFYQDVVIIGTEIDRTKNEDFYHRYAENRLMQTISNAVPAKAEDYTFFSFTEANLTKPGSQSLIVTFNNGISLDKPFSNHVIGRLYVDNENNLTLAYWPSPKRIDQSSGGMPIKKEILLPGVSTMAFEFFIAPEKSMPPKITPQKKPDQPAAKETTESKSEENGPEPKGEWTQQPWSKDYKQLPVMMKINLTLTKEAAFAKGVEKITYAIPLVNNGTHVVYD